MRRTAFNRYPPPSIEYWESTTNTVYEKLGKFSSIALNGTQNPLQIYNCQGCAFPLGRNEWVIVHGSEIPEEFLTVWMDSRRTYIYHKDCREKIPAPTPLDFHS